MLPEPTTVEFAFRMLTKTLLCISQSCLTSDKVKRCPMIAHAALRLQFVYGISIATQL